jgi:hypothetical protein
MSLDSHRLPSSTNITCNKLTTAYEGDQTCQKVSQEIKNFLYKYAQENIAILKLFTKDPYYTLIKKDEEMSFVTFVSNIGGLCGLCMGLSLVSVFEIFYHSFNTCLSTVSAGKQ